MVEALSKPTDYFTSDDLADGIRAGRVTTRPVEKKDLSINQQAGWITGFEVNLMEVKEGEYYVTEQTCKGKAGTVEAVKSPFPLGKSYRAISLTRPPGVTNDRDFDIARIKLPTRK